MSSTVRHIWNQKWIDLAQVVAISDVVGMDGIDYSPTSYGPPYVHLHVRMLDKPLVIEMPDFAPNHEIQGANQFRTARECYYRTLHEQLIRDWQRALAPINYHGDIKPLALEILDEQIASGQ